MPLAHKEEIPDVDSDIVRLGPNIYYNEDEEKWAVVDVYKDSMVVDVVNNKSETAYVSIKHAPATTGDPVFTEIFKVEFGGGTPSLVLGDWRFEVNGTTMSVEYQSAVDVWTTVASWTYS